MAGRKEKRTVDYFPHYVRTSQTIHILESEYGLLGYCFWFKLLELLCNSSGLYYCFKDSRALLHLSAQTKASSEEAIKILNTLAELGKIDADLLEQKIIFCQQLSLPKLYRESRS